MNNFENIIELLNNSNAYFSVIPKARTAKIVRTIIDIVAKVPDSLDVQIKLCQNVIEWCKTEKRTFLRQRVEGKVTQFQPYLWNILARLLIKSLKFNSWLHCYYRRNLYKKLSYSLFLYLSKFSVLILIINLS